MEKWTESLEQYLEEGKLPLVGEIFSLLIDQEFSTEYRHVAGFSADGECLAFGYIERGFAQQLQLTLPKP